MRISFYAPLKAPDHPVPSGDRTMARALVKALDLAGHDVTQPARLRSFLPAPDEARQSALVANARRDIERITRDWEAGGPPDAWFTYHNHYKAPDLLGPVLTRRFARPYVLAEASHAPKRADAWTSWHTAAEAAIRAADLHVCFTARDRQGLSPLLAPGSAVIDLPPFLDIDDLPALEARQAGDVPRLVTLAMMRPGDKQASYACLAEALGRVGDLPWHLDIIGDGPARTEIAAHFAPLPAGRITWHGALDRVTAWKHLGRADLFVWPGFGEAFGLAFLEAQAAGVPVLALDTAGVSAVVVHGVTGVLVAEPSAAAFAAALRELVSDPSGRARMGTTARRFVLEHRTLGQAAARLDHALRATLGSKVRCHA